MSSTTVMFDDLTHLGSQPDPGRYPQAQFGSFPSSLNAGIKAGSASFAFGSQSTQDTLQSLKVANQILADYGLDRAYQSIEVLLQAHNMITADLLADFVEITTDRQRRFGTPVLIQMQPLDQYGVPNAQKVQPGFTVGFPLRRFGCGLMWTKDFWEQATTVELAGQLQAVLTADARRIQYDIKNALFNPTSATFIDMLVDGVTLSTKVLANGAAADLLPVGPNGEQFVGNAHTHYMYTGSGNGDTLPTYTGVVWPSATGAGAATAAQMNTDMINLTSNVLEHFNEGELKIYIAKAQEVDVKTITGFVNLLPATIVGRTTADQAPGTRLDLQNTFNRLIGYWNGYEVWVKPWMVKDYLFACVQGVDPPLCMRVPKGKQTPASNVSGATDLGGGNLRMISQFDTHPFYCSAMERKYGFAVWNRVNGAVLNINTASGPYPFTLGTTFVYP